MDHGLGWARAARTAALLTAGAVLAGSAPAWAHTGATGAPTGKRALQRLETELLGPGHAAEHAAVRRAERRERAALRRLSPAQRRARRAAERRRVSRTLARAAAVDDATLARDGRWLPPFRIPVVGIHAALLPTGEVMWFSRNHDNRATAYLWNPRTGELDRRDPPKIIDPATNTELPANIWCGGQSLLADGRLLVTGGNLRYEGAGKTYAGLATIFTFDPFTREWAQEPSMRKGRWYPTQTLMADGRTVITAGWDEHGEGDDNPDIELFTPGPPGQGTLTRLGSFTGGPSQSSLYPHQFLMPSGGVLTAGPRPSESWLLHPTQGGTVFDWEDRPNWSQALPNRFMYRTYGTGVLVPGGPDGSTRVMQIGGYSQNRPTATTEVYDEATRAAPVLAGSLNTARAHHNTVLLPDSSMVTVGGGFGFPQGGSQWDAAPEHKTTELLDAGSSQWRLGPAQVYPRAYHSTALLLPDGRVVSAGDERKGATLADYDGDWAEIYEPPYLFKGGSRPVIAGAPGAVAWGRPFRIATSSPGIARAVLVAPGATTHANDMHQRVVPLRVTSPSDGAGMTAVAPNGATVAPPGYYMLFLLDAQGTPSEAAWVRLDADAPPPPSGSGAPAPPAPPAPGTPGGSAPSPPTRDGRTADRAAPRVSVRVARSPRALRTSGRVRVRVALGEPGEARIAATVQGLPGRATLRGPGPVAFRRAGTRTVVLRAPAATRRALARARRPVVVVRVRARDRAGNAATRTVRWRG